MKITIDRSVCTGHGRCYTLVPELFEPDDDGYGVVVHRLVPPGLEAKAAVGVANCPEDAISLSEHDDDEESPS